MNFVLVVLALLASSLSETKDQGSDAQPANKEKKICRQEAAKVASRMKKSTCRTAAEWEEIGRNKTTAGDLQRMGAK